MSFDAQAAPRASMHARACCFAQGLDVRKAGWQQRPQLRRAGFGHGSNQGREGSQLASVDGEVRGGL